MTGKKVALLLLEKAILVSITLMISMIFLIPIIVFYAPQSGPVKNGHTNRSCSNSANYSGLICRNELSSLATCFSKNTPQPLLGIPAGTDQTTRELKARVWISALPLLANNITCIDEIMTLLCLHAFDLCDADNALHTPTMTQCLRIRDTLCPKVWKRAIEFLGGGVLPDCESLPNVTEECVDNYQGSTLNESQIVRPVCGEFLSTGYIYNLISLSIGFACSILVVVIAVATRGRKMLQFPQVLMMYMNLTVMIMSLLSIAGFTKNSTHFCGSMNYAEAIEKGNETTLCKITGVVYSYGVIQLSVLAVLYVAFLTLALTKPFTFKKIKESGKIHYFHAASLTLAVLLPLPSGLIFLKDGFRPFEYPVFFCFGRNVRHVYFAIVLPMSVLLWTITNLLVILFWILLKKVLATTKGGKNRSVIGTAEIKITIVMCYYLLLGMITLVSFTISRLATNNHLNLTTEQGVNNYIICAATEQCTKLDGAAIISTIASLSSATTIMLSCLPVIILLFSINFQTCITAIKEMKKKVKVPFTLTSFLSKVFVDSDQLATQPFTIPCKLSSTYSALSNLVHPTHFSTRRDDVTN